MYYLVFSLSVRIKIISSSSLDVILRTLFLTATFAKSSLQKCSLPSNPFFCPDMLNSFKFIPMFLCKFCQANCLGMIALPLRLGSCGSRISKKCNLVHQLSLLQKQETQKDEKVNTVELAAKARKRAELREVLVNKQRDYGKAILLTLANLGYWFV